MNRTQAMTRVRHDVWLSQVAEHESAVLDQIVTVALTYDLVDNRWQAYEQLKRNASQIAGWNAQHDELATSTHYQAMIDFIDWLLPYQMEVDEVAS